MRVMRRLVLVLMIALLPLRGWVGEAMAAQMAMADLQAGAMVSLMSTHTDCALHADHGAMQAAAAQSTAPEPDHGDGGCNTCQACHHLALELPSFSWSVSDAPPAALPLVAVRFASAFPALTSKPPIA